MKFYVIQISVPLTEFPVNFIGTQLCACIYTFYVFSMTGFTLQEWRQKSNGLQSLKYLLAVQPSTESVLISEVTKNCSKCLNTCFKREVQKLLGKILVIVKTLLLPVNLIKKFYLQELRNNDVPAQYHRCFPGAAAPVYSQPTTNLVDFTSQAPVRPPTSSSITIHHHLISNFFFLGLLR